MKHTHLLYLLALPLAPCLIFISVTAAQNGFSLSHSTVNNGGGTLAADGFTLTGVNGQPWAGFVGASTGFDLISGVFAGAVQPTPDPRLAITKVADVTNAIVGETAITYSYRVTNTGDVALTVQAVDDSLGPVALIPLQGGTLLLPQTVLQPGQVAVGTLNYTPQVSDLPGPLVNTVVVTGTPSAGAAVTASALASVAVTAAPPPPTYTAYFPVIRNQRITPLFGPTPFIAVRPVTAQGETFYSSPLSLNTAVPGTGRFYFSGVANGLQPVGIDDQVAVVKGGVELFVYTFGSTDAVTSGVVEVPRSVVEAIATGGVVIQFRDVFGSTVTATPLWLVWAP